MKNLILFAVIAFAAWYGWTHYEQFKGKGQNEVVVTNQSAHAVDRLRIQIAQRTEVVEHLEAGASVMRTFPTPPSDVTFQLNWEYAGLMTVPTWSGGLISAGPMLMRHTLLIQDNGDVIWSSEQKPQAKKRGLLPG